MKLTPNQSPTTDASIEVLKRLRDQADEGIRMIESGDMRFLSAAELARHAQEYGNDTILLADFEIRPRK